MADPTEFVAFSCTICGVVLPSSDQYNLHVSHPHHVNLVQNFRHDDIPIPRTLVIWGDDLRANDVLQAMNEIPAANLEDLIARAARCMDDLSELIRAAESVETIEKLENDPVSETQVNLRTAKAALDAMNDLGGKKNLRQKKQGLKITYERLIADIANKRAQIINEKNLKLEKEIENLQKQLQNFKNVSNSDKKYMEEISLLKNENKSLNNKINAVQIKNEELRFALEHAKHTIAGYETDIKTFDDKIKHLAAYSAHSKCEQCKTGPRDVLFLPCRHFFVCEECSNNLRTCPYCDKVIEESIIAEY